ncbi:Response regulator of zinc sigma-54-dependent two-component system [Labilithrix luteola]|uniref:Response regulator of zinc sigma-54-dependent two-component system n=1 Tax=Labilithrix luteola TaxID=1391654 RepID=A0A0K1PXQ7_9BACT|nr:sigma 54-interacting transcriptional regulator [Labilithrix luteola]AKU97929.1 Response regulator of zinc sigma-54-dependent two-component system [Labilithrix luteola]
MHSPTDDELSTLLSTRFDPNPAPEASFVLTVASGETFEIAASHGGRLLLGSGPACELRLTDRELSRRHASLEVVDRSLRLVDLGSTNGTFVNGVRVRDALLVGGEQLRVGGIVLRIERSVLDAPPPLPPVVSFGPLVGASTEMRRLYPLCERLAAANVPVIIEGETGTGKEALAEALHTMGPRAQGPFVVFDCTAVPPNLVESELFGHEKGAFTGATAQRRGVFELASGGTLLIDEIGDLDASLQPKLLRAVERSEVRRIGGDKPIRVDVRILAATRRDLDKEVQAGRFRDDLFHRLAVTRIELPPLRERRGDITVLARWLCHQLGADASALPHDVLKRWEREPWPGNVRQLRNAVARFLALGDLAAPSTSPTASPNAPATDPISGVLSERLPFARARERIMADFERRYVEQMLADHGGDIVRAAEASGMSRRYFTMLRARTR